MTRYRFVIVFCVIVSDLEINVDGLEQPSEKELSSSVMISIKRICCHLLEEEIRKLFLPTESDRYSAILKKYLSTGVKSFGSLLDVKVSAAIHQSVKRNLEEIQPALLAALKKTDESKKHSLEVEESEVSDKNLGLINQSDETGKNSDEENEWEHHIVNLNRSDGLEKNDVKMKWSDESEGSFHEINEEKKLKRDVKMKWSDWSDDSEGSFNEIIEEKKLETEPKKEKKLFAQALGPDLSSNKDIQMKKPAMISTGEGKEKQVNKSEISGAKTSQSSVGRLSQENEEEDSDLKMLIIPSAHGGPRVHDELKRVNINLANFGVIRTSEFPSGAILCECRTLMEKAKLKKVINELGNVFVKPENKSYPNSARIQNIPIDTEEEEIFLDILEEFNREPSEILFIPYKDDRKYRSKAAIFYVSDELFKAMEASPEMKIRRRNYNIDCSIHIRRCANCQLLGHRAKFCKSKARPRPSEDEHCIDCIFYNEGLRKSMGSKTPKFRNVKHRTDNEKCPSKLYFITKWRNLRRIGDDAEKSN